MKQNTQVFIPIRCQNLASSVVFLQQENKFLWFHEEWWYLPPPSLHLSYPNYSYENRVKHLKRECSMLLHMHKFEVPDTIIASKIWRSFGSSLIISELGWGEVRVIIVGGALDCGRGWLLCVFSYKLLKLQWHCMGGLGQPSGEVSFTDKGWTPLPSSSTCTRYTLLTLPRKWTLTHLRKLWSSNYSPARSTRQPRNPNNHRTLNP